MQTLFEGSWEDVLRRSDELAGHRVRVIVLDSPSPETTGEDSGSLEDDTPLAELLQGKVGTLSFGPPDLATRDEHYLKEIMGKRGDLPDPDTPTS